MSVRPSSLLLSVRPSPLLFNRSSKLLFNRSSFPTVVQPFVQTVVQPFVLPHCSTVRPSPLFNRSSFPTVVQPFVLPHCCCDLSVQFYCLMSVRSSLERSVSFERSVSMCLSSAFVRLAFGPAAANIIRQRKCARPPPTSISSRELIVILSLVPPPGFIFNLSSRPSSPTPLYPLNEQFVLSSIASSPFHPFVPSLRYPFETNKPMFFEPITENITIQHTTRTEGCPQYEDEDKMEGPLPYFLTPKDCCSACNGMCTHGLFLNRRRGSRVRVWGVQLHSPFTHTQYAYREWGPIPGSERNLEIEGLCSGVIWDILPVWLS
ncbi:hypothetical protein LR48_Vigan09g113600 [Vigna angularis]|uniref:Uncharacterized protein n=1 Tax=Phaseolus angularis TaxID=3914 RepID=A0A0L9VC47_PHAAN|nr:hypothetical protein LR48_Vigan09g113600 [Vigna angularis]